MRLAYDQIVILWCPPWATTVLRYAVLTKFLHSYCAWFSFTLQYYAHSDRFHKPVLLKVQLVWNQVECAKLGTWGKPRKRWVLSLTQDDWTFLIDYVLIVVLLSLIDHSEVTKSSVGWIFHLFCNLDALNFTSSHSSSLHTFSLKPKNYFVMVDYILWWS